MNTKRNRLETFILPLLQCIVCPESKLEIQGNIIRCLHCNATYPVHNDIPIMTTYPPSAFEYSPSVVVENKYPQQWIDIVDNAKGAPVLDLGSGNNPDMVENLVKLEIFALPNVDVVGYGEDLPFKEKVFHTVFSGAVIEHVKDPFSVIKNIHRILKEKGEVYIETAFLQPVHAYPSHYYNMTRSGLEHLCSEFDLLESGVKDHQAPSFTLHWILNSWQEKLSGDEKDSFLKATVAEILEEYRNDAFSKKWFSSFSRENWEELACGVYFHGRKPLIEQPGMIEILKTRIKNAIKCLLGRY